MPLPPRIVVLNRFGLLDQVVNDKFLRKYADDLINSESIPHEVGGYFKLFREKKILEENYENLMLDPEKNKEAIEKLKESIESLQLKFDKFFEDYKQKEPSMAKVLQAHLFLNSKANKNGKWVLADEEVDADFNKRMATPLIEELMKEDIGVGYRMHAQLATDREVREKSLQKAAYLGDLRAEELRGSDYLAYLVEHAHDNEPYRYNASSDFSNPMNSLNHALREHDPDSVRNAVYYLTNLSHAVSVYYPSQYDLVFLDPNQKPDVLDRNTIYFSKNDSLGSYQIFMTLPSGEMIDKTISESEIGFKLLPKRPLSYRSESITGEPIKTPSIEDQKDLLLPKLIEFMAIDDLMAKKGVTKIAREQNVLDMLEAEQEIEHKDTELNNLFIIAQMLIKHKGHIDQKQFDNEFKPDVIKENPHLILAQTLIKKYGGKLDLINITKEMDDRLNEFRKQQKQQVLQKMKEEGGKSLAIDADLRMDLNTLYDHYQREIDRIRPNPETKLNHTDQISINLLEEAKEDLLYINKETDYENLERLLNNHIAKTETGLKKLPHPNYFVRGIENFVNKIANKFPNQPFNLKSTARSTIISNFAKLKADLNVVKAQTRAPEQSPQNTSKADEPSRRSPSL